MSGSFLTNAAAQTGINTGYVAGKAIALTMATSPAVAGSDIPLPQQVYLDNIEVRCTPTGAVTTLTARLTYDAAGDDICAGDGTITLGQAVTTATLFEGVTIIQAWKRMPGKTLTLYLHLKTNANTIDVAIGGVRLHWINSVIQGNG